jgi:DMSO/TMAO reductase YedYZ molybdopterin-dependent catalytic subunit
MNGMKLSDKMNEKLPPGQHEIPAILRWNIDHPGIITENPKIDLKKWTLTVDGEVEKPITLNWHDFLQLPFIELKSDFHCVEGWSVRKLRCLDLIELLEDNVLLSYKLNGKWLEASLGGPLRLVVPNKYAYKSAMWIERITFTGVMFFGYWEKRKYSNTADVWKNDRFSGR